MRVSPCLLILAAAAVGETAKAFSLVSRPSHAAFLVGCSKHQHQRQQQTVAFYSSNESSNGAKTDLESLTEAANLAEQNRLEQEAKMAQQDGACYFTIITMYSYNIEYRHWSTIRSKRQQMILLT
jgi:hypothetical protein